MQETKEEAVQATDEEVSDVLIAISVVAKRLAKTLTDKKEGGTTDEPDERTGCAD